MTRLVKQFIIFLSIWTNVSTYIYAQELIESREIELDDLKLKCLAAFDTPNTIDSHTRNLIYSMVSPYKSKPDRRHCSNLSKYIHLNVVPGEVYDFSILAEANFIYSLRITGAGLNIDSMYPNAEYQFINLPALKSLENLKELFFEQIDLRGNLNSFLKNSIHVEILNLEEIHADSISELSHLNLLNSLIINKSEIEYWPKSFGPLSSLNYLNISNNTPSSHIPNLEFLRDLSGLKIIALGSANGFNDINSLAQTQSQLRAIFLDGLQNENLEFEKSVFKNSLEKFVLMNSNVYSVNGLATFKNLKELYLSGNGSLKSDLKFLDNLKLLVELYIDGSPLDRDLLSFSLNGLENLHFLRIRIAHNSLAEPYFNSGNGLDQKLYNLRYLNLEKIGLDSLPSIKHMSQLEELNLSDNIISSLPAKEDFPADLQFINISNNHLVDASSLLEIPNVIIDNNQSLDPTLCPLNAKSRDLSRACHELNNIPFVATETADSNQSNVIHFSFDPSLNIKLLGNKFYNYQSIFFDENSLPLPIGEVVELNVLIQQLNLNLTKSIFSISAEDHALLNYSSGTIDYYSGGYTLLNVDPQKTTEITERLAKLAFVKTVEVE